MNTRTILFAAALVGAAAPALAAPASFPAERMTPALDRDGILGVEWGDVGNHLDADAGVWLGYAYDPLVLYSEANGTSERVGALVQHRIGASFLGSLTLLDYFKVGLEVPFTLYQARGSDVADAGATLPDPSAGGLGDIRLVVKTRILRADRFGVDVAFLPTLTVPSGVPGDSYLGDSGVTFSPAVAVSRTLGDLRLAANFGYKLRPSSTVLDLHVGPELTYAFGGAMLVGRSSAYPVELMATLSGATGASSPFSSSSASPLELDLGASVEPLAGWQLFGGAGLGLVAGYGTPDARVFLGLRWAPRGADADHDHVPDAVDRCPERPEDADGFEDGDGCPDLDNDHDGIPDLRDRCPDQAEDVNGVEDADGCPDLDEVRLTLRKIEINDTVYFDTGKARIQSRSFKLLGQVASTLKANPQITRLRIEGHTDDVGSAEMNLELSQKRAEAVRTFLIEHGIAPSVLEAVGYGKTRPLATNKSTRGRERNRRVELVIIEVDGKPVADAGE